MYIRLCVYIDISSGSGVSPQIVINDLVNKSSSSSSSTVTHLIGMSEFLSHIATVENVQLQKSKLDTYFEDGLLTATEDSSLDIVNLDALKL